MSTLSEDYPKCMIKAAFRPEHCSKCSDESACKMMQWHLKQAEKEKQVRQQKRNKGGK